MSKQFQFFEKFRDRDFDLADGYVMYNNKKTSKCGGVNWGYVGASDNSGSYIVFADSHEAKRNLANTGLKIHLSVEQDDIEKALDIVAKTVKEHNIPAFKCKAKPHSFGSDQEGKTFCIYLGKGQDNPAIIQPFLKQLEQRLREAQIRRGPLGQNIQNGDNPVRGATYSFYRYQEIGDREKFAAPESGDIMEFIAIDNTPKNSCWYNRSAWRAVQGYHVFDNVENLTIEDQSALFNFLNQNNVHPQYYGNNNIVQTIAVSQDELTFLPALYKKEWQMEDMVKTANQWNKKESWRVIDGIASLDYIDKMDEAQRVALGGFLISNKIPFLPIDLEHRDKTLSQAIEIREQPDIFFNKLNQYNALNAQKHKGKNR